MRRRCRSAVHAAVPMSCTVMVVFERANQLAGVVGSFVPGRKLSHFGIVADLSVRGS